VQRRGRDFDYVDLAEIIKNHMRQNMKYHKLIIIDEIDNFSHSEQAKKFLSFLQIVIKAETNTTIIGIANSVELLNNCFYGNRKELELIEEKLVY
jgi:Cdc6-like AAA superfamily ATPase